MVQGLDEDQVKAAVEDRARTIARSLMGSCDVLKEVTSASFQHPSREVQNMPTFIKQTSGSSEGFDVVKK